MRSSIRASAVAASGIRNNSALREAEQRHTFRRSQPIFREEVGDIGGPADVRPRAVRTSERGPRASMRAATSGGRRGKRQQTVRARSRSGAR